MISFVASDGEMDDSLSLAASDAEELSGFVTDPRIGRRPPSFFGDEEVLAVEAWLALGWRAWCQDRNLDPVTSDMSVVI